MNEQHAALQRKKKHYGDGLRALEKNDFAKASREFDRIASKDDLWGMLGQYYAAEAYLRLGLEQMKQGDFEVAARSLTKSAQLNSRQGSLPRYLVSCFAELQKFDHACRVSDSETSRRPEDSDPRIRLALSLYRDGQLHAAIQTLRDGILESPEHVEWHFQLGVLLASHDDYTEAAEAFLTTTKLDSAHTDAHFHLGLTFAAQQNPAGAIKYLTIAQRQRPHDPKIALYLGMAAGASAELEPQLHPVMPLALPALEIADVEELTHMLLRDPDVIDAFITLPDVDSNENLFELLSAVLEHLIVRQPHRADLHHYQARIYTKLGMSKLAIRSCERAVEIEPQSVQALVTLAKLYRQTDRQQDAAAPLQQIVEMGYEYADVYFHLGCIHRDQGRRESACDSFRKALRINSRYTAARESLEALAA